MNFYEQCGTLMGKHFGDRSDGFKKNMVNKFKFYVDNHGPFDNAGLAFKGFLAELSKKGRK